MGVRSAVRRAGTEGQALAEFALIAPWLFLLLFGVIQIGLMMGMQNGLVDGVRDTARRAATYRINEATFSDPSTFAAVCSSIETNLASHLGASIPGFSSSRLSRTVSYEWQANPTPSGGATSYFLVAHVTATYQAPIWIPLVATYLPGAVGGNLPLSASEQMRVENPSLSPSSTTNHACAS